MTALAVEVCEHVAKAGSMSIVEGSSSDITLETLYATCRACGVRVVSERSASRPEWTPLEAFARTAVPA